MKKSLLKSRLFLKGGGSVPIFGIDVEEWAALVTILVALTGLFMWIFKTIIKNIISDLNYQIRSLTDSIKQLSDTSTNNQKLAEQHHEESQKRLMEHDIKIEHVNTTLGEHEERIKGIEDDIDDLRKGES